MEYKFDVDKCLFHIDISVGELTRQRAEEQFHRVVESFADNEYANYWITINNSKSGPSIDIKLLYCPFPNYQYIEKDISNTLSDMIDVVNKDIHLLDMMSDSAKAELNLALRQLNLNHILNND